MFRQSKFRGNLLAFRDGRDGNVMDRTRQNTSNINNVTP